MKWRCNLGFGISTGATTWARALGLGLGLDDIGLTPPAPSVNMKHELEIFYDGFYDVFSVRARTIFPIGLPGAYS